MARRPEGPRPPPDAASLQATALAHLGRFAATEQGLSRVLLRKIDSWARQAEGEPEPIAAAAAAAKKQAEAAVARLVASGAVSDAAFAEGRARSLARAGRSSRAIGAHLRDRGVAHDLALAALPDDMERELAACLIHARRRRMGPWRRTEASPESRRRELASFARAGFSQATAGQALRMDQAEAEARIAAFRAEV